MRFPRSLSPTERFGFRSRAVLILSAGILLALLLVINHATSSVPHDGREGEVVNPDPPPRLVVHWCEGRFVQFLSGGSSPIVVTVVGSDLPAENEIRVWNALSGKTLAALRSSGKSYFNKLVVSPDGKYIAASGHDDVGKDLVYPVHVWEVATAKEVCILPGNEWSVGSLAFSPDSRCLTSTESQIDEESGYQCGKLIKLWNIPSGKQFRTIAAPPYGVGIVAFMPDGRRLVSAAPDGAVRVWDVATGKLVQTFTDDRYGYGGLVLRPTDGKLAAAGARHMFDRAICLWDLSNGRLLATLCEPVESVQKIGAFNKNGRWLATANMEHHNVTIWDIARRKVLHKLPHNGMVESATFSPDGRWLAVAGYNDKEGFLTLWDMYPE